MMKNHKLSTIIAAVIICFTCSFAFGLGASELVQVWVNGSGVSDTNQFPVKSTKSANTTVFASLSSSANPTSAIDVTGFQGGAIHVVKNSGTAHYLFSVQASNASNGTFAPLYTVGASTSAATFGTMTTTANRNFNLAGIKDRYIKIVPVVTGSGKASVYFTGSKD